MPLELNILILLAVVIFLLIGLYREIFHPSVVFLVSVSVLVVTGILTPSEALSGFSNEQVATIVLLLVISGIMEKMGAISYFFSGIFKDVVGYKQFMARMFISVSSLSAFINNTPIVALLMPYVYQWAKKNNISPSKLLIPLSYAAILGGTITLVGTSTNLLINGFVIDSGFEPLGIFDFAYVGIPATIAGFVYMLFIGNKLLPERKDVLEAFLENKKEYMVETYLNKNSPLIGKSVKEAGLRKLKGLFLAEIIREKKRISPVKPEEILEEGDILIFVGQTESITELLTSQKGLSLPDVCLIDNGNRIEIVEVVIPVNSYLINKKIRETDFRGKYDAAILAVHRNGEKLRGKIGEIKLKAGDLLLLITGKDFWKRAEDTTDFYIISKIHEITQVDRKKILLILSGFLGVLLLSALKIISVFVGFLFLLALILLSKSVPYSEVKRRIDLNLVIIAALSLAIGKAVYKTGTAEIVADVVISIFSPFGILGALIGVYLITNILTEFVTNIAAASVTFPIAVSVANTLSVDPLPFILAVAYGASASFITPIGYQTNLIVYGAGGYRFKDFLKVGFPMSILYAIICISILYFWRLS